MKHIYQCSLSHTVCNIPVIPSESSCIHRWLSNSEQLVSRRLLQVICDIWMHLHWRTILCFFLGLCFGFLTKVLNKLMPLVVQVVQLVHCMCMCPGNSFSITSKWPLTWILDVLVGQVEGQGHSAQSQEENVAKLIVVISSEGIFKTMNFFVTVWYLDSMLAVS